MGRYGNGHLAREVTAYNIVFCPISYLEAKTWVKELRNRLET